MLPIKRTIPRFALFLAFSLCCYGCFDSAAVPEELSCSGAAVRSSLSAVSSNRDSLFKANEGDVWGFIDINGNQIIEPAYKEVTDFSEGLSAVKSVWDGRWGYIDSSGSMVISPVFDYATPFNEGRAVVTVDGNQGLIDKSGEYILSPTFEKITKLSQGRAFVLVRGNWKLVDKSGHYVTQNSFKQVTPFRDGLAAFTGFNNDYNVQGYIDREGNISILTGDDFSVDIEGIGFSYRRSPIFRRRTTLRDLLEYRPPKRVYGLINTHGEVVVPFRYSSISISSPCRAIVTANSQYGVIDLDGNVIVPTRYTYIGRFSEGLAIVQRNLGDKYGYIDERGRLVIGPIQEMNYSAQTISPEFPRSRNFHNGRALFKGENGKYGYIDKSGSIVIEPSFDKAYPFKDGLAQFENANQWGYINLSGEIVWRSDKDVRGSSAE
jgi:hypothetical protein